MGFSYLLHQLMLRCGLVSEMGTSNRSTWSVGICLNQRGHKLKPKKQRFALDKGGDWRWKWNIPFLTNHVQMNVALMGASDILNECISPACAVKQWQQLTYKSGLYFFLLTAVAQVKRTQWFCLFKGLTFGKGSTYQLPYSLTICLVKGWLFLH